ncbi:MAG: M6 family metalloprotease domain-containing protein [bacterium]
MPAAGPPGSMIELTLQALNKGIPFRTEISQPSEKVLKGQARGLWNALIILIDFPDYRWDHQSDPNFPNADSIYTLEHFNEMLFSLDTYKDPYSLSDTTGSMRDFYLENSYGQFDLQGVTTAWYTASQPLSFYANNDSINGSTDDYGLGPYPHNAQRLVEEAVQSADPDVDFSEFDNNGDGFVDALFVVHAGPGAEEIYSQNFPEHYNYLWSNKFLITADTLDGVLVSDYTLEPENGTIGVFCHEFGHELGLPDLYDTDGSSEGLGEWGLMGSGGWCHRAGDQLGTSPAHFSAWSKARLGWLEPINVTENLTHQVVPPVESNPVAYRLWRDGEVGGEYFLLENRQNIGFDVGLTRRQKDFDFLDANGLIIYHVDNQGNQGNESRRLIDVEEASPYFSEDQITEQLDLVRYIPFHQLLFNGNRGDNGDPFPGYSQINEDTTDFVGPRDRTVFDDSSIPNSNDNDGFPTFVSVSNIQIDGENIIADLTISPVTLVRDYSDTGSLLQPLNFELAQNYPNPFNPTTKIQFTVPNFAQNGTTVQINIYNTAGQLVRTLVDEIKQPGVHTVTWDGTDNKNEKLASGIYVYQLKAAQFTQAKKMILTK